MFLKTFCFNFEVVSSRPLQNLKQNAMESEIKVESVIAFFKNNWFKLSLVLLALYVWFKKDLTFQVSLGAPEKTEEKAAPAKEKFTDTSPVLADKASVVDKLEVPFIGSSTGSRNVLSEFSTIREEVKHAYLERFAKVALAEQKKFGIPASVILGTALYHSAAGRRDLALEANNQFALPCSGDWKGQCVELQGRRYRSYESAWASFRDFSLFVKENFAYLKGSGYKTWAIGLEKAGFGEAEGFAKNLIEIIEEYRLQELDK